MIIIIIITIIIIRNRELLTRVKTTAEISMTAVMLPLLLSPSQYSVYSTLYTDLLGRRLAVGSEERSAVWLFIHSQVPYLMYVSGMRDR